MINFNLKLFNNIADLMKKYIYKYNSQTDKQVLSKYINICCDQSQIDFLLPILDVIQKNNPKPNTYTDSYYESIMFLLLLYLYYSLVLGEQTDDYLDSRLLSHIIYRYWGNYKESIGIFNVVYKLYIDITTGDLNYCSQIRRMFFGMEPLLENCNCNNK
jgi:hypothetical protein